MLLFNCPAALRHSLFVGLLGIAAAAAATPAATDSIVERGPLVFDGVAATGNRIASTLPAWLDYTQTNLVGWWADGSLVVGARDGARRQWYRIPAAGTPQQPLPATPGITGIVPHPYDARQWLLVARRADGGAQLLLRHVNEPRATALNAQPDPDSPVLWAHDGRRIAFAGSGRDGSDVDIYTLDTGVAGAQPRLIAGGVADPAANTITNANTNAGIGTAGAGAGVDAGIGDTHWQLLDWSPDDSRLLLRRALSADRGALYTVDVGTGEIRPLVQTAAGASPAASIHTAHAFRHRLAPPAGQPVEAMTARFVQGGEGIDYIGYGEGDDNGDYLRLRRLDLDSGTARDLSPAMPHDVQSFDVSADGRYLAYVYTEGGLSQLTLVDQRTGTPLHPADLPAGVIHALHFDRSGRHLALAIESTRVPLAVYVVDTQTQATTRWTPAQTYRIDPARFVMPTLLRFPTWDSSGAAARELSAYVYRPLSAGRHPVLLWLHDRPQGAWRPGFDGLLQYFVEQLGFVVIAPDVRGSSGYGRTFAALAGGRLRADAARDVGALLVWIGAQPDLDGAHVVVMGQGYGGYLALQALAQYGVGRLAGGIDIAGPSDLVSWLETTAAPERALLRMQFGDERDVDMRAFLHSVSPLPAASGIHQPLLIVQGSTNREVPAGESGQLLARLRSYHAEVGCITVRDAGADLDDSVGRDAIDGAIASFLQRIAATGSAAAPVSVPPAPLPAPVQTASRF